MLLTGVIIIGIFMILTTNKKILINPKYNLLFGLAPLSFFVLGIVNYQNYLKNKDLDFIEISFALFPFYFYCLFNLSRLLYIKIFKREPNPYKRGFSNLEEFSTFQHFLFLFLVHLL